MAEPGKRQWVRKPRPERPPVKIVPSQGVFSERVEVTANEPLLRLLLPEGMNITKAEVYIEAIHNPPEDEKQLEVRWKPADPGQVYQIMHFPVDKGYQQLDLPFLGIPDPHLVEIDANFSGVIWYALSYRY